MHGTQGSDRPYIWPQPDQMLIESVAGGEKNALEQPVRAAQRPHGSRVRTTGSGRAILLRRTRRGR